MELKIINHKNFRLFVNLLGVVLSVGYILMVNYFWFSNRNNAFDQSLMFGFLICFVFMNYQYFFGINRSDPQKRKKSKEGMVTAWISLILLIFVLFIWGRVKFWWTSENWVNFDFRRPCLWMFSSLNSQPPNLPRPLTRCFMSIFSCWLRNKLILPKPESIPRSKPDRKGTVFQGEY